MSIKTTFMLGRQGAKIASKTPNVIVVIDTLRATSSIVTLFTKGVQKVMPINDISEFQGIIIGEKEGKLIEGCTLNNSPTEILNYSFPSDKPVAIKTSNGSYCIINSKNDSNVVLIGSSLNANACALAAAHIAKRNNLEIYFILAGLKDNMALEDLYVASLIYNNIPYDTLFWGTIKPIIVDDLYESLLITDAAKKLGKLGYENDLKICSTLNSTDLVPHYDGNCILLFRPEGEML